MKKTVVILLILVLSLSAAGCSTMDKLKNLDIPPMPTAKPAATATPEPTEAPTEAPVKETQPPEESSALTEHVVVGITRTLQEYNDPQNGTLKILTFSYDTPAIYIEGHEEASARINEYIARLDETYVTGNDYGVGQASGANAMLELAQDNYAYAVTNQIEIPLEFSSARGVRTKRIDSECIDIVFTFYEYTGGAHGRSGDKAYVFDTETGDLLALEDLSSDTAGLVEYLGNEIVSDYENDKELYNNMGLSEAFIGGNPSAALKALVRDGSWYFDSKGISFFADEYEIAPYSAGKIVFTVPYSKLEGHIDAKWFPDAHTESGTLTVKTLEEISDGSVEVIDRVETSDVGTEFAIAAQGSVYQVKLSRIESAGGLYETQQLWAGSHMKDCALQMRSDIPDGMPDLMLSYLDSTGTEHELVLTQSGEDGHVILLDPSEIQG